jgi:Ca2+-binding EF-hand superfamily protein
MIKTMTQWAVIAVLVSYLALPVVAAQGTELAEPKPRTNHDPGSRRSGGEQRWKKLDQDNDGKISRSEWQRNEQAFDRMDADKDGFLTKEEMRSAARGFREKHRNRLQEMDADADGNISRSEWKGKEDIFNRLDANNDGLLSREELRGARQRHGPGSRRSEQSTDRTL